MEKYPCPCCGYLTYPVPREDAIAYICPVCFWENDVFVTSVDEPSDENHGIIPHTVLIDPSGVIIAKNLRGKELEEKIAQSIKSND